MTNSCSTKAADAKLVERICAAIDAVKSPYDHHTHTGEDCAFGDALEAAQRAVRAALEVADTRQDRGALDVFMLGGRLAELGYFVPAECLDDALKVAKEPRHD